MPRTKKGSPPSYRQHSSGQAVVTVRGRTGRRREILLGPWQSAESKAAYQRVLALLTLHNGCYPFPDEEAQPGAALSVGELILAWWKAAEARYGPASLELDNYRAALPPSPGAVRPSSRRPVHPQVSQGRPPAHGGRSPVSRPARRQDGLRWPLARRGSRPAPRARGPAGQERPLGQGRGPGVPEGPFPQGHQPAPGSPPRRLQLGRRGGTGARERGRGPARGQGSTARREGRQGERSRDRRHSGRTSRRSCRIARRPWQRCCNCKP